MLGIFEKNLSLLVLASLKLKEKKLNNFFERNELELIKPPIFGKYYNSIHVV
jgi:hypothetical protein